MSTPSIEKTSELSYVFIKRAVYFTFFPIRRFSRLTDVFFHIIKTAEYPLKRNLKFLVIEISDEKKANIKSATAFNVIFQL